MPVAHRSLGLRATLVGVTAGLLVPLLVPTSASAEDRVETVVGELVQAWPEHDDPREAVARAEDGPLTWIETAEGESVRVSTEDLGDGLSDGGVDSVPVGATVKVVLGSPVEDSATTEEGLEPAREVLSADVLAPTPEQEPPILGAATDEVTVVMVIPPGGSAEPGRTLTDVLSAINGPVAAFWRTQTNSAVQFATAASNVDWFQGTVDCSNPTGLWAEAAGRAGWTPGAGKHLMVYLPRNTPGCSYGLAQVGASLTSGGRSYVTDVATSVMAHELGHNLGLGHSSGLQCDGSLDAGTCRTEAYRDYYDVMGISWSQLGSLSAPQAARLGLIPSEQLQSVTSTTSGGTFTLAPISGTTGIRAIRIVGPDNSVYWLEYRPAAGQDSWLAASGTNPYRLQSGVLLRRAGQLPDTSLLLDGSPSRSSGWSGDMQVALPLGRTVGLSGQDFTIAVYAAGPASALIAVTSLRGDRSCATRTAVPSSAVSLLDTAAGPAAFVVGADRGVWGRTIDGPSAWGSLGGSVLYGPATATDGTTTYVFVVGTDGALYMRSTSGSGWTPWLALGGALTASPAAASLGNGHVRVFGRGGDGSLWARELAYGVWWPWVPLGGYMSASPTAAADVSHHAVLVSVRGSDGEVYTMSLPLGASSGSFDRVGLVVCSALALNRSQVASAPAQAAYLDSRLTPRVVDSAGTEASLGGGFTSAPAVESAGGSFLVAGRGTDHGLWVYDGRPGHAGWVGLGGFLL